MNYQMLVLDLDGTLTNSRKEITEPTRQALIEIQEAGKKVVLASGRPTYGIVPLAEALDLAKYGSYILSFNGGRITQCSTNRVIYDRLLPQEVIEPIYQVASVYPGVDIMTYQDEYIVAGLDHNEYTDKEVFLNKMKLRRIDNFVEYIDFPINKLLITGEPDVLDLIMEKLHRKYNKYLSIYKSEAFFLEIMPQNIDKARSLQRLLNSIGMKADSMICCGDGYNDISMIEFAGLGVAMENAKPLVKESANFITKSNDDEGILFVIDEFMRD